LDAAAEKGKKEGKIQLFLNLGLDVNKALK
jgi:hypothetical protein